jgi:hypothetical protein
MTRVFRVHAITFLYERGSYMPDYLTLAEVEREAPVVHEVGKELESNDHDHIIVDVY